MRAAEQPPECDMPMKAFLGRIYKKLGPAPNPIDVAREEYEKRVDLEIIDKIVSRNLHVWGRTGPKGALLPVDADRLPSATIDHRKQEVEVQWPYNSGTYWDLHFNKAEIDRVWPPADDSNKPDSGPPQTTAQQLLKRAPPPPTPPVELAELERAPCMLALHDTQEFIDTKVAPLMGQLLTQKGDAAQLRALLSDLPGVGLRVHLAHARCKELMRDHDRQFVRMGMDLKPLSKALVHMQALLRGLADAVDYPEEPQRAAAQPVERVTAELAALAAEILQNVLVKRRAYFDG
jgi:hypothetical protein